MDHQWRGGDPKRALGMVGESFSPQPTARIAKAITSRFLIVEVKIVLEDLEFFIFVCDDAEVNRRETLQSKQDFITK